MPNIITLYCCGSGSSRNQYTKYAVPKLYSVDTYRLFGEQHGQQKSLICDGPGGAPIIKAEAILKQVESGKGTSTGGLFNTSFLSGTISELSTDTPAMHGGGKKQAAFGKTSQDNIVLCMQFLWEKFWQLGGKIDAINMVGWSRGGVTAIMLAHAIKASGMLRSNPNTKVNIMAFDPVPGGVNDFNGGGDSKFAKTGRVGSPYTLSSCVTNYTSIIQENLSYGVGNGCFKCTVPTPEPGCGAIIKHYPLPGEHGTGCSYNEPDNFLGKIGMHIAQKFLLDNGTRFSDSFTKNNNDLTELYASGRMQYVKKNGLFSKIKTAKKNPSKYRSTLVSNSRRGHKFFVNPHHAELIKNSFPSLYAFLDRGEAMSQNSSIVAAQTLPETFKTMEILKII